MYHTTINNVWFLILWHISQHGSPPNFALNTNERSFWKKKFKVISHLNYKCIIAPPQIIKKIKGEEVKNPRKNLPLSIIITLLVVTILYCGLSTVLTLMVPYYLLDPITPIPQAFSYVELYWAKHIVSIGAIISLLTWLYMIKSQIVKFY